MFSFIPVAYCSTTVKKHFNPDAASDFYSRVCNRNISSSGSKQQEIFNFAQENCFLCCYELSTRGRCWCVSVQRMSLLQAGNSLRLWIQTNRQNWKITAGDRSSQRPTHAQDWTTLVATLFCRLQRGVSRVADAICWALSWAWELNLSRCKSLCRHHMDQRLCHTHRFKPLWEGTALCSGASGLESHCWHVVDWTCVSECKRFL